MSLVIGTFHTAYCSNLNIRSLSHAMGALMEMLAKKRIELEQSEALLLNHMRNLCLKLGIIEAGTISLAAGIRKYYAPYYDDTWVWGITSRIATVLREMGSLCESETHISSPLNHDMCANILA